MKLKVILILLFFGLTLYCQTKEIKTILYSENGVEIRISYNDKVYNIGDSVILNYIVDNQSKFDIIIFDPSLYYPSDKDKLETQYKNVTWDPMSKIYAFKALGGTFQYEPGYFTAVRLIKIKRKKKFKYTFFAKIKESDNLNFTSTFMKDYILLNDYNNYTKILFYIGYEMDKNSLDIINTKDGYSDFATEDIWINSFEMNLKRVLLGPIWIKVKY